MRLDKYLKVSRIIKRRAIANEICDAGKVLVNQRVARASHEVKVNDMIEIKFNKSIKLKVLSLKSAIRKGEEKMMYETL